MTPRIEVYAGLRGPIHVMRDDLLPGGTKSRYVGALWAGRLEAVYASPAHGGMQLALAYKARELGRQATIFVAHRRHEHPRTQEARAAGAQVISVAPGYLSQLQSRARAYADEWRATYIPLGGWSESGELAIASAAAAVRMMIGRVPEVWCAGGSGLLTAGLQRGIPEAEHHVVQVGRALRPRDRKSVV